MGDRFRRHRGRDQYDQSTLYKSFQMANLKRSLIIPIAVSPMNQ